MNIGKVTQVGESWERIVEKYGELTILEHYISNIKKLPCLISCPYRKDKNPSFGLKMIEDHIIFKDFATGESGGLLSLIKNITGKTKKDITKDYSNNILKTKSNITTKSNTIVIKIKKRDLDDIDINYWKSYGVNANLLSYYDIHPISYYWINDYRLIADKLAYAYRIVLNRKVYYKIYQPLSKKFKWCNNYPANTISLEKYISNTDNPIIICSSVKDALCLKHNIGNIDVCALQGEGYNIPDDFLNKYKDRKIIILFDNDKAGIEYSKKLSKKTNIPFLEIPLFDNGKDISDYYKIMGKDKFCSLFNNLLFL